MERKTKILPVLSFSKPRSTLARDRLKIEEMVSNNLKNRGSHKDYRFQDDFSAIKAANFISRIDTIDSPNVLFSISDQIKELVKEKNSNESACAVNDQLSPVLRREGDAISPKLSVHRLNEDNSKRIIGEERHQAMALAKWMDDKLKGFRQRKTISFLDILEYKQTILNYALGRIIDSLTKKCKEEGQILSLIWNNTFNMFESIFNILVQATDNKEKQKQNEAKELHQIFEVNHNFLREQNAALKKENQAVFEKMKDVILWNKRLRRERKQLNTSVRILEYRNCTYSQALQQTVDMLLQSTPEPVMVQTAKKVIVNLGREKHKKKHFFKQQVDSEVNDATRDIVYNWLKKNNFTSEEKSVFLQENGNKEDRFILSELDDINEMNRVNIYDYFKLTDVAVQATVNVASVYAQCERKLYQNAEVMTKSTSTAEQACQTMLSRRISDSSAEMTGKKQESMIKQQSKSRHVLKQKGKNLSKKGKEQSVPKAGRPNQLPNNKPTLKKGYEQERKGQEKNTSRPTSIIINLVDRNKVLEKSNQESYSAKGQIHEGTKYGDSQILMIEQEKDMSESGRGDNTSMSDLLLQELRTTKMHLPTKNVISYNSNNGNIASMEQYSEMNSPHSTKVISTNKSIMRRKRYRKSLSYISNETSPKPVSRLKHKYFTEMYHHQKQVMNGNREEFFDQIIRRRSFISKRRVEFANFNDAEQNTQRSMQYMRGGRKFKTYIRPIEQTSDVIHHVDKLAKKVPVQTNIAKIKTLSNARSIFTTILSSIQQLARIPPKNKAFVNSNIVMITKYISSLILDYLKQFKKEKEDLVVECQKALYPLNILLMERMTFKYGLKDIAEKKIKNFVEKILTFAAISQKIGLYSLLLGLEDDEVGTDELLVYVKCLVYFDGKKAMKDSTQSSVVEIEVVRQHLRKILQYFFDREYVNLLELKLEIYFQQNSHCITVEGISILIIRELLKRKKDLKLKYLKVHQMCAFGDNFFTNVYRMLKMVSNYRPLVFRESHVEDKPDKGDKENIGILRRMHGRSHKKLPRNQRKVLNVDLDIVKIAGVIKELLKRSDIIDEEYGKSITSERFITAAIICNIPNSQQLDSILAFLKGHFEEIKSANAYYSGINCEDYKSIDKLSNVWGKSAFYGSKDPMSNLWSFARVFSAKIEEEVNAVMGKLGSLGVVLQTTIFNLSS